MNKLLNKFLVVGAIAACLFTGCSSDDSNDNDSMYVINGFEPVQAFSGDQVTIIGSGFDEEVEVYFNESKVEEYVSRSSNQIVVVVPANAATGRIGVLGKGGYTFSKESFTYIPGAEITRISPTSGAVGDQISILGVNFHSVVLDELKVYFNGAEGRIEGEVVSASSERIDVVIPEGAVTGAISVAFGDIQQITGPELVIGEKEPDPFTYRFTHLDVVEISGKCNPSVKTADGEAIGERDKSKDEYEFVYKPGFDETTIVGLMELWDSAAGNYIIFKVNVLEADDYYIYFETKGNTTSQVKISVGSDMDSLKDTEDFTKTVTTIAFNKLDGPFEYGTYPLEYGINYVRIDFIDGLGCIHDLRITNVCEEVE